jgi:hypothetical protein
MIIRWAGECVGVKNLKVAKWLHYISTSDKARYNAGADVQAGPVDVVVQCRETAIKRFRFDEAWPPFCLGAEIHAPSWTAIRHNKLLSVVQCTIRPGSDTAKQDAQQAVLVAAPTAVHRLVH